MDINFNGTCSSHAPILIEYISVFNPKIAVEFGSGVFSTEFLLNSKSKLYSFEISSYEWYEFLSKRFNNYNWTYIYEKNIDVIKNYINNIKDKIDIAFVDDGDSRAPLTNFMFDIADTIIAHDTQCEWAKDFFVPNNYFRIDFKNTPYHYESEFHKPFTTLMTKDENVFNYFSNIIEKNLYEKYDFPYNIIL